MIQTKAFQLPRLNMGVPDKALYSLPPREGFAICQVLTNRPMEFLVDPETNFKNMGIDLSLYPLGIYPGTMSLCQFIVFSLQSRLKRNKVWLNR